MTAWHRVRSKYWPDMRGLSRNAKLLGLYLLTCTHRTTEGLYHLPIGYAAEDMELAPSAVRKALAELVERGFVSYDDRAQVVLIRKALTYGDQIPKGEKQIKGAVNTLKHVPTTTLRDEFLSMAETHAPDLHAALTNGYPRDTPSEEYA